MNPETIIDCKRSWFVIVTLFGICAMGCDMGPPKGVIVKGKVLKGGQVMPVTRPDIHLGMVEVHLVSSEGNAEGPERALAAEDGSFTFPGLGKGVKAGKYRLSVYHRENGPPGDSLNGVFSDEKSPITVTVPTDKLGGTLDLGTIDLDKPPTDLP